jgi:hypothetical protein
MAMEDNVVLETAADAVRPDMDHTVERRVHCDVGSRV